MNTSFYIIIALLGILSGFNFLRSIRQTSSDKGHTIGIWLNGLGFSLALAAILIGLFRD